MMRRRRYMLWTGAALLAISLTPAPALAEHGKPHWGEWFKNRVKGDSPDAAIKRGEMIFNKIGCAGCHPRGGTIGGHARNIMGKLSPRPIPNLHGVAKHFPRVATPFKKLVTLGQMNDVWVVVFLGREPLDPNSQKYADLEAYVASLSADPKAVEQEKDSFFGALEEMKKKMKKMEEKEGK